MFLGFGFVFVVGVCVCGWVNCFGGFWVGGFGFICFGFGGFDALVGGWGWYLGVVGFDVICVWDWVCC